MSNRRSILASLLAAAAAPVALDVRAQSSKPVVILVPYPAGGPGDTMARSIGEVLAERLGQTVVPDFKPGGGGQIAAATLLQNPADGNTLMLGEMSVLCSNKLLYKTFRYDPMVDFDPIAPLMAMPVVLYVPKASPFNSLGDLITAARSKVLNFASQGNGSVGHLLGEMLKAGTNGQYNHIAYKGSTPAMMDVIGGQVDFLFDGIGPGLQHLASDRLKAIAVAGPQRLPQIPNVATTAEAGQPEISMPVWFGVVARAGTPAATVKHLNEEVTYAMKQPKVSKRFTDLGFQPLAMTPEAFKAFMKRETDKWGAFIKARQIALD